MMTVCGWLAGVFLIATSIFFVALLASKHKHRLFLTPLYILFIGCFISVLILMIPLIDLSFLTKDADCLLRGFMRIILAIHNSLQVFTINIGAQDILKSVQVALPGFSFYFLMMSFLLLFCPMLTLSFILSLIKNISAYLRLFLSFGRDWYVFSELNDKSIALARDLRRNHKKASIVFTDVFGKDEEASYELIEEAKKIGAICFKKDIVTINFRHHNVTAKTVFFTIGENETENVNQAIKLIDIYKNCFNVRLFVFSASVYGELLLTKADKGKIKVRRINEVRSLINRLLYEHGEELFENARSIADGEKKIAGVIVGLGQHGTQMLKSLTWYCQMDGYHVEIDAFELDNNAKDRFTAQAPELMSREYNGVTIPEEAEYTIKIHSGFDVTTERFATEVSKLKDATYVFISLGSDEANIRTAVEMRMLFERMKIKPVIQAVVRNSAAKKALTGITNYKGQAYDIDYIGDLADSFSESVIMNSVLEADALRRHVNMNGGKEEEFWQYEYNYNSSVASAIHAQARIACKIPGATKREKELTPDERAVIQRLEHRRWNAYMRSEGYIYSGSNEESSRNDLAKMHNNLVKSSSLTDEDKQKDSRVGTLS